MKVTTTPSRSSPSTSKDSKPSYSNVATQLQCPLCNGSHRLFKCDRFNKLTTRQRLTQVKQLNLCFNCLHLFSKNHTCSTQVCRQCHKRHHTLLHIGKQNPINVKRSTRSDPQADAKGITTAEVNTYCSFKGRPRNHILLATAMVEVRNKASQYVQCRALFTVPLSHIS